MITNTPLDPSKYYELCNAPTAGAILQFVGVVRNNTNSPKGVIGLFYESEPTLATETIQEIVNDAITEFNLIKAHCIHRIGELSVGDQAIVVTTAGAHREETYLANRYIVDRVKYEAAIWKKELFMDGTSEWGKNSGIKPEYLKN